MVPHGDRVCIWNDHGDPILARLAPAGYDAPLRPQRP